jgi:hypothetical protein
LFTQKTRQNRKTKTMTSRTPRLDDLHVRRLSIVDALAWLKSGPVELANQLDDFEFSWSGSTYKLTHSHFTNAFDKWRQSKISSQELVNWAEALEMREDVDVYDRDENVEDQLKQVMYTLSNPDLFDGNLHDLSEYCSKKFDQILP